MAEKLPYIVSGDAEHLVKMWGQRKGLKTPDRGFFTDFQNGLMQHIGDSNAGFAPELLSHEDLVHGLQSLLFNYKRGDAVALDRAYVGDDFARHFEVTRAVDRHFNSIGTMPRPHTPSIPAQLDYIVANSGDELTLVDDVIFSGDAIVEVAEMFQERGTKVSTVLAAVAIGEGRKKIENVGIEVVAVVDYDEVADEICERDFVAGIPFSGRTVYREDGKHYSAPYFEPFGRPEKWASIGNAEAARKLSIYCIEYSIELWRQINQLNDVTVSHSEVPRILELDPKNDSFVAYLEIAKESI